MAEAMYVYSLNLMEAYYCVNVNSSQGANYC